MNHDRPSRCLPTAAKHPLLSLELVPAETRFVSSVNFDFTGTADLPDLTTLRLVGGDGIALPSTDQTKFKTHLNGRIELPAGHHHLDLMGAIRPGANLLHQVAVTCDGIAFEIGAPLKVAPRELPPLRLAYPIHKRGQFNWHTTRIPAIARANDGTLLAVHDLRYNSPRDLQEQIDIGLSRSTD